MWKRFASNRPNSSGAWKQRQRRDPFVQQSHQFNYRSRSAFKLLQINQRFGGFLRPGAVVVDCGAAPGGWTQVIVGLVGCRRDAGVVGAYTSTPAAPRGHSINVLSQSRFLTEGFQSDEGMVVAIDVKHMDPVPGAHLLCPRDFTQASTVQDLKRVLCGRSVDVLLSDMMPNLCGQREADHFRSAALCEAVISAARTLPLKTGGVLLFKILQGGQELHLKHQLLQQFTDVRFVKPDSSRQESRELFVLCQNYLL